MRAPWSMKPRVVLGAVRLSRLTRSFLTFLWTASCGDGLAKILADRRYVHLRSSILYIQRKWRERSKKKTFNTKFYILYKKSITKHRRRMARRKPSEIIRRYFYAWYDVGRHRKQEVLRTPVKNLSHRRFRDMMRVSIHLQVLDLRAARFFCYFSKSTCHFFLDEYMFDVTTFLKMLQVVLNHTMMNK